MVDIAQAIIDTFSSFGDIGMLAALVIVIWIDGTAFPTLPEAWLVFVYGVHPNSFWWGATLVVVTSCASLLGNMTLYSLVKAAKLPKRVQKAMRSYTNWLILKDERLLILNRFAPILPYTGAFIAVCNWNLKRCIAYLLGSAMAKTSVYIVIFWASYGALEDEVAPYVSLGIVAIVMMASIVSSFVYKRRHLEAEQPRSQ